MPVRPTYPGVYIEEIPSGVRTIAGVSTSVTAFVGSAKRGPIDRAVTIRGFADFERRFGGLMAGSQLGYAVRQFFQNGGSEAIVIRLAKDAQAATLTLNNQPAAGAAIPVLSLTAIDAGLAGNSIAVRVSYGDPPSASRFALALDLITGDLGQDISESWSGLSMNSADARYVVDLVNDESRLVTVARPAGAAASLAAVSGTSTSGQIGDPTLVLDDTHKQFQVAVNGLPPVTVTVEPASISGTTANARLTSLAGLVEAAVRAAGAGPEYDNLAAARDGDRLVLTSGVPGETSSVRVLPGRSFDASARLLLGEGNGGTEADAAGQIRPRQVPDRATLTGTDFAAAADLDNLPSGTKNSFAISLDGYPAQTVDLGTTAVTGTLAARLGTLAAAIQAAVRALKPSNPAYRDFTAGVSATNKALVLASGTRGPDSSIAVSAAAANSIAAELNLLGGTPTVPGRVSLTGGTENPYQEADEYNLFIADRAARQGIYALEAVDIFNLLCLPGVTDAGILADAAAYCRERRAFMIVDAPRTAVDADTMAAVIAGTALPKTDRAAVYFPWVSIADPLKGGKPIQVAPSGSVAGVFARTDSTRGVWKAPAGIDATLAGVQRVGYVLTDAQNGTLNPRGVNAIRLLRTFGPVVWGARTLRGDDDMADEYKYVPIRRLALYIEESLYRGTQWVVFEPNDEPLWAQIRLNVGAFMNTLFRQGAFQGKTPAEAYLVKCDKETTTQNDIDRGIVNILVGFAPLKPAEFVILQIQQKAMAPQT